MYHKTHPARTPNLSSFCRSGPVYCHIKNLITSTIFSNHLLHVPYKKRYKIDTCESTNISFLKARESLECSVLNLALMSYTCSWWYKSTLCVKQWTNGFHICVLHSVTKKNLFLYGMSLNTDWYQIFKKLAVSKKYCYGNLCRKNWNMIYMYCVC